MLARCLQSRQRLSSEGTVFVSDPLALLPAATPTTPSGGTSAAAQTGPDFLLALLGRLAGGEPAAIDGHAEAAATDAAAAAGETGTHRAPGSGWVLGSLRQPGAQTEPAAEDAAEPTAGDDPTAVAADGPSQDDVAADTLVPAPATDSANAQPGGDAARSAAPGEQPKARADGPPVASSTAANGNDPAGPSVQDRRPPGPVPTADEAAEGARTASMQDAATTLADGPAPAEGRNGAARAGAAAGEATIAALRQTTMGQSGSAHTGGQAHDQPLSGQDGQPLPTGSTDASAGDRIRPATFAETLQAARPDTAPSQQVSLHVRKAVAAGVDRLTVQLQPERLGSIEIQLDVADDGRVQARIVVDRSETLHLLQRDSRGLEQALSQAGLSTDGDSLNFSLRQQDRQNGQAGADGGDQPADGQGENGDEPTATLTLEPQTRAAPGRLDISV